NCLCLVSSAVPHTRRHHLLSNVSHYLFFYRYRDHRDLHSFPTRRSSDLRLQREQVGMRQILDVDVVADRGAIGCRVVGAVDLDTDRKSTRLNSSHLVISYAVFCLKKKKKLSR